MNNKEKTEVISSMASKVYSLNQHYLKNNGETELISWIELSDSNREVWIEGIKTSLLVIPENHRGILFSEPEGDLDKRIRVKIMSAVIMQQYFDTIEYIMSDEQITEAAKKAHIKEFEYYERTDPKARLGVPWDELEDSLKTGYELVIKCIIQDINDAKKTVVDITKPEGQRIFYRSILEDVEKLQKEKAAHGNT